MLKKKIINPTITNHAAAAARVGLRMARLAESVVALDSVNEDEVISFLSLRPVHTVIMSSYIQDNGIDSPLNRGTFYGYRNHDGELEGVALIGHSTLVEARSDEALQALAYTAREHRDQIHLIMSSGDHARLFWDKLTDCLAEPRLTCIERLYEASFPFLVPGRVNGLRTAKLDELVQIAEAQAEVAFIESGVDPMLRDREGFLKRVARRIEQGRIYVVVEDGRLVFKADVIAETSDTAYLEGVYVAPHFRGEGLGSRYLAAVTVELLSRVNNVCLLTNKDLHSAHRSFEKAGYRSADECTTLFV